MKIVLDELLLEEKEDKIVIVPLQQGLFDIIDQDEE